MAQSFRDPLAGINAFAPAFWKLIAEPYQPPGGSAPEPIPEPAMPQPPPKPPLTNDALEALRESTGGLAKDLRDLPPAPPPPETEPPLTNQGLRRLRDPAAGSGDLRDIPSPPAQLIPEMTTPGYSDALSTNIRDIWAKRARIDAMKDEAQRRLPSQQGAFHDEIRREEEELQGLEEELRRLTRRAARHI